MKHAAASLVILAGLGLGGCWSDLVADSETDLITDTDTDIVWSDSERMVILISLDGFRWDYRDKTDTPALDRIVAEGVAAEALVPVFPSKTFPNHFTQVTGLYPPEHGIVGNSFWDPELSEFFSMAATHSKWWGGEPIWITAAKQDRKTITVFWPGSETEYEGWRPHHWLPYDGSMSNTSRVIQLLTWLDEDPRPHFATLYFSDTDHGGHAYGPDSSEIEAAIREVDSYLGLLLSGLEARDLLDRVDIIVVSDHGMTELSRDRAVFLDDLIDLDDHEITAWGAYAAIEPKSLPVSEVLAQLADLPHATCTDESTRPPELRYTGSARISPILCLAEQGWSITSRDYFEADTSNLTGATHGFAPSNTDMHGIFYARGPHFEKGHTHPAFESVHLYALMARLLELEPAANSGSAEVTAGMLAPHAEAW